MIRINLVPAEILAKAAQKQQAIQAAIVAVLALLVVAMISAGHWYRLKRLEAALEADTARLKKLEVIVAKVEELEKTTKAVKARLDVINDLLKGRPLYPAFMSDFVRSVPPGVRVKSLNTSGGGSAAAPLKLNMAAEARSNEDIASWVRRMEETGRFQGAELGAVRGSSAAGDRLFEFSITVNYKPAL